MIRSTWRGRKMNGSARESLQAAENTLEDRYKRYRRQHVRKQLRSAKEVERLFAHDILPVLGARPLPDITRADIHTLLDDIAERAPVHANRVQANLSAFLNWCLDREYITANVVHRMKHRTPEKSRQRVLSEDELKSVWRAAETMAYPFGSIVQLLLLTGQRLSEVGGAQWSEFDLTSKSWRIPAERSKSGVGHLVPLSALSVAILRDVPRMVGSSFLFTTRGDRPVSGFSKAKARFDETSGVSGWRYHDLRRTFATGLRSLEVDRLVVSMLLNHADSSVTAIYDRYAEDKRKRIAVEKWGRHLHGLVHRSRSAKVVQFR